MTRTRALITYPNRQYLGLVNKVIESGEPFLVPCTKTQAASLRGELYAWRRAAEEAKEEAQMLGLPVEQLRDLAWRITDKGLETIPTSLLVGPALIEAALGGTPAALESPAQRALEALRQRLGTEEPKS